MDNAGAEKKPKNRNITEGSIIKGIANLAVPSMTGLILLNVFSLVDMYFVGWLGHGALAAVSLASIFVHLIYTFALGISIGTVALVSRSEGMNDRARVQEVGRQSLYMGLIMSVIVAIGGNLVIRPALVFLGAGEDILHDALAYSRIVLTGSFVVFIPMSLNAFLRGYGDAVTPMKMMGLAAFINGLIDPIFIFGWAGFPKMGVAGSALATVIARAVGAALLLRYVMVKTDEIKLHILPIKMDFKEMFRIVKIGIYGSLQSAVRNFSNLVMMKLVASFGATVIAAYGVGLRLRMAIILPLIGIGSAASTMVGQNLGAKKSDRSEKSAWLCAAFGEILMVLAFIPFFFYPNKIMQIFNQNPLVVDNGVLLFKYFAVTLFFINLSIVIEKSLGGAGDTFSPMLISLLVLFLLRIPLAWYLMKPYGPEGIWMGISATSILQGIVFTIWFATNKWKKQKV